MRLYTMGWISVDTRLPKKLEKVLFHWLLNGHGKNISMGYMSDSEWHIYLPYHSQVLNVGLCHVTHWRYLPDFPKFKVPVREVGEIIIDDPLNDRATAFAKKFCEENKDMLKRLADR